MLRTGNADNSFANQRPVKCGLCQHPFPKLAIRTTITKKSILDVLKQFSINTGIRSSQVEHLLGDDEAREISDAARNSPDKNNVSGSSSVNSSPYRSPSPSTYYSPSPTSKALHFSASSPSQQQHQSSPSPSSIKNKKKKARGKNPTSAPSSLYTPAPICKFCGQFFGVHDVPLSEEQAATAIELGVPLLELTKGSKKHAHAASPTAASPSPGRRGASSSRGRGNNNMNRSMSASARNRRRRHSASRSPVDKGSNNNNASSPTKSPKLGPTSPARRRSVSRSPPNSPQQQEASSYDGPMKRKNTLKLGDDDDSNIIGNNNNIPQHTASNVSFGEFVVEQQHSDGGAAAGSASFSSSNMDGGHHHHRRSSVTRVSQLNPKTQELFHRYMAVARKSIKGTMHHQQETETFARSMSMLMLRKGGDGDEASNENTEDNTDLGSSSDFQLEQMITRGGKISFNRSFATSGPVGLSFDQYLNNSCSDDNPTPPPSISQAMKLASGLLKRELHKMQASRLREQISKVESEARGIANGDDKITNKENGSTTEEHDDVSKVDVNTTQQTKEVKFEDGSPSNNKNNDKNSSSMNYDEDDFEIDSDDRSSSSSPKASKGKQNASAGDEMNMTRTPSQIRAEQEKNEEGNTKDEKAHQDKRKATADASSSKNSHQEHADHEYKQPTMKDRRFHIAMNKVDNLVQTLLHQNDDESTSGNSKNNKIVDGASASPSTYLNSQKSKQILMNNNNSHVSLSSSSPSAYRLKKQEQEEAQVADELIRAVANAKRAQRGE